MSPQPKVEPYGTWTSPITSELTSGSSLKFNAVHVNQETGQIYLVESRPSEKGRSGIAEIKPNKTIDILPKEYSAASKVHEYGGGGASITPDGSFILTDSKTDGVFHLSLTGDVQEIISGDPKIRYADFDVSRTEPQWILGVQEFHREDGEVLNTIVAINSNTKISKIVVSGADFYSHPKFSYDGTKVSWMQWNHPDMPWTGSEVHVGDWNQGEISNDTYVSGKARKQAVCQPRWHRDGSLFFENDVTGFFQMYRYDIVNKKVEHIVLKGFDKADIGQREIKLANSTYVFLDDNTLIATCTKEGEDVILLYDIVKRTTTELDLGICQVAFAGIKRVADTTFAVIGGTTTAPIALYIIDITKPSEKSLLKSSANIDIPTSYFSETERIKFLRTHGTNKGTLSYAMFIPPKNPEFAAPEGAKPPLIVSIHGGPTTHTPPSLSLESQYFTSRGYAYCHVNHAGSMGYGRAYRDELEYNWGIKDVEDTVSCIEYLSKENLVDGERVGIRGGSAGGYTVLQSMVNFPEIFASGCSLYGVGNLKALGEDSHKFESHYLFDLLFPENASQEEKEGIYFDRSPCFHADKIKRPLTLLQGRDDMVVPIAQSEEMERILRAKGADVKLVVFDGEGHGWKMEEHIKRSIEEEEELWKRTLIA